MIGVKMRLEGLRETERKLVGLRQGLRNQVLGPALTESARIGVSAAKNMLKRRRTGLLKRSLAYKMSPKRKDGGYRVIGADRGFKTSIPGSTYGPGNKKAMVVDYKSGAKVQLTGKKHRGKLRTAKISRKAINVTSGLPLNPAKYDNLVEGGRKANQAIKAKAMYFRISSGVKGIKIFRKKVRAVKPHPFMKPASEYLKLRYPYIVYKHMAKVAAKAASKRGTP